MQHVYEIIMTFNGLIKIPQRLVWTIFDRVSRALDVDNNPTEGAFLREIDESVRGPKLRPVLHPRTRRSRGRVNRDVTLSAPPTSRIRLSALFSGSALSVFLSSRTSRPSASRGE